MFIRVDAQQAGPNALGILVPHGTKTLVIVRPRASRWDLLPARWDGDRARAPQFCAFTRDEAAQVARRLVDALTAAATGEINPIQTFGDPEGTAVQIWLRVGEFVWIVCRRTPGEAYQPMVFPTQEQATREAETITGVLWPTGDAKQEYYVNTQNFS